MLANRAGYGGAAVSPPHLLRGSIQSDCGEMKAWLLDTGYRASEILGLSMTSGREGGEMQGTFNSHAGPKYPLVVCQSKVQISLPSLRLQLAESGRPAPATGAFFGPASGRATNLCVWVSVLVLHKAGEGCTAPGGTAIPGRCVERTEQAPRLSSRC